MEGFWLERTVEGVTIPGHGEAVGKHGLDFRNEAGKAL